MFGKEIKRPISLFKEKDPILLEIWSRCYTDVYISYVENTISLVNRDENIVKYIDKFIWDTIIHSLRINRYGSGSGDRIERLDNNNKNTNEFREIINPCCNIEKY